MISNNGLVQLSPVVQIGEVISKTILLVKDSKIKDPAVLSQLSE